MPPSKWSHLLERGAAAWAVFAETANPHTQHDEKLEPHELKKQAAFESIDYHKSYPQMYTDHLRANDKRNLPLPPSSVGGDGGGGEDMVGAHDDTHHDHVAGHSTLSFGRWFNEQSARNAASAIVEEVTAYDASSRNSTLRWLLHVLIALTVGCIAASVMYSIAAIDQWRADTLYRVVVDRDNRSLGYFVGLLFWTGTSVLLIAAGTACVVWFEPAAGGSGIADVIAYLNGVMKPKVVSLRTFAAKSISCVFAVAGGLPVGAEAPLIHLGAIAGAGVTQGRSRTLGCQTKLFQAFRNNKDRRDFITAGAACGVSAAFGAPIGGLLFVMEEVSSFWDHGASGQIFLASMISFSTIALINSLAENDHTIGRVTNSAAVLFEVNIRIPLNLVSIFPSLFLGAFCGLLAVTFTKCNLILIRWRRQVVRPYAMRRFLEPVTIVAIFSFVMYVIALIPGCQPTLVQTPVNETTGIQPWQTENVTSLINLTCHEPNTYSPLATLALSSGKQTIRHLFNRQSVSEFPAGDVFIFFILYFSFACWSSGTFIATGLVIPTLVMGAAFGRLFGIFLVSCFASGGVMPNAYLASESWMDPGVFALIGAGALFGGINRMAMSICVIMVELSGELHYLLPIMVSIVVSKATADWLCEPLFHQMLHLDNVPYLPLHLPKEFEQLTAADVMTAPVVTLRVRDTTANILHALRTSTHHAFPIVADEDDPSVTSPLIGTVYGTSAYVGSASSSSFSRSAAGSKQSSPPGTPPPPPHDLAHPQSRRHAAQPSSHPAALDKPQKRLKFIGTVTREDIQVFLSLPNLQHFAVNEGLEMPPSSPADASTPLARHGPSTGTLQTPLRTAPANDASPSPFALVDERGQEQQQQQQQPSTKPTQSTSPEYLRRLEGVMRKINSMSWVDWMRHQTSLFFVIGDKQWHLNWSQTNTPDAVPDDAHAISPQQPARRPVNSASLRNQFLVNEKQLPLWVDLSLIVNRSPWVIPPFFNLSMAYTTFRSMGLRHMVVVDGDEVRGMITRKDLLLNTLRGRLLEMHLRLREAAMLERARKAVERARAEDAEYRTNAAAAAAGGNSGSSSNSTASTPGQGSGGDFGSSTQLLG